MNPRTEAFPDVGNRIPVRIFIVVDFPAPFGPINPNNSPDSMEKERLRTASVSKYCGLNSDFMLALSPAGFLLVRKVLDNWFTSITGMFYFTSSLVKSCLKELTKIRVNIWSKMV
jgi:hypothetical protein